MTDLETALAEIRNAWLAGRSAIDRAPAEWREAIGATDELALVAFAGHATDVLTRQTPAAPLVERPLLPKLAAPLIPEPLRPRFRRLLGGPRNVPTFERQVLAFAAARGYAAHPADWLPDVRDDHAPDLYAPWLDWVCAEARPAPPPGSGLTIESYDTWSWSECRKALETMRAEDPEAALAIVAAKAGGEPAERRLRLVELLQTRLSDSDASYLESLSKDRSDRVQALARALLARLGRRSGDDTAELASELAAMVDFKRVGLLKRRMQLTLKPLKTTAQAVRRRELFGLVSLAGLAAALSATELLLVESAPDGDAADVLEFVTCAALTGSDPAVRALFEQLLDSKEAAAAVLHPLAERFPPAERTALLPRIVARDSDLFATSLSLSSLALGTVPLAALAESPSHAKVVAHAKAFARGDDTIRVAAVQALDLALPRLGLLLDAPSARALLDLVPGWGLSPAEPRFDMLHFNAALTPENTP
jgi:hypothetical protein